MGLNAEFNLRGWNVKWKYLGSKINFNKRSMEHFILKKNYTF